MKPGTYFLAIFFFCFFCSSGLLAQEVADTSAAEPRAEFLLKMNMAVSLLFTSTPQAQIGAGAKLPVAPNTKLRAQAWSRQFGSTILESEFFPDEKTKYILTKGEIGVRAGAEKNIYYHNNVSMFAGLDAGVAMENVENTEMEYSESEKKYYTVKIERNQYHKYFGVPFIGASVRIGKSIYLSAEIGPRVGNQIVQRSLKIGSGDFNSLDTGSMFFFDLEHADLWLSLRF